MRPCINPHCTGTLRAYGCATADADGDLTQRMRCASCGRDTWEVTGRETKGRDVPTIGVDYGNSWGVYLTTWSLKDGMWHRVDGRDELVSGKEAIRSAIIDRLLPNLDVASSKGLDEWAKRMGTERQVTLGLAQTWTETDDELRARLTGVGEAVVAFFAGLVRYAAEREENIDWHSMSINGVPVPVMRDSPWPYISDSAPRFSVSSPPRHGKVERANALIAARDNKVIREPADDMTSAELDKLAEAYGTQRCCVTDAKGAFPFRFFLFSPGRPGDDDYGPFPGQRWETDEELSQRLAALHSERVRRSRGGV